MDTHTHALCSLWNVKSFQVSDQSTYKLNDYKYKIHEVFVQAIINFKLFTDIVPQHSTVFRLYSSYRNFKLGTTQKCLETVYNLKTLLLLFQRSL